MNQTPTAIRIRILAGSGMINNLKSRKSEQPDIFKEDLPE